MKPFPGESAAYRAAREKLLAAEIELRDKTEEVASRRRDLPLGGVVPVDYAFEEIDGRKTKLSELFGAHSTLVIYSFMYGPKMNDPCPMCTSFLDGLNGQAHHITQKVALAVVAQSPVQRIHEFARSRGWNRLHLLSAAGTTYQRDYHGESETGEQWPMMNVFVKRDGTVAHFWASEMFDAAHPAGQDARHIDIMWLLWNVLDLTPGGRGDWYPALVYPHS